MVQILLMGSIGLKHEILVDALRIQCFICRDGFLDAPFQHFAGESRVLCPAPWQGMIDPVLKMQPLLMRNKCIRLIMICSYEISLSMGCRLCVALGPSAWCPLHLWRPQPRWTSPWKRRYSIELTSFELACV